MHLIERTQVLSGLAGVPNWETHPKTWERLQAVLTLEKRQERSARFRWLLRRPDSVPWRGWSWPVGWRVGGGPACCREVFCPRPCEFCSVGQPVPKGQSVPAGTSTGGKSRTLWPRQRCRELTSDAEGRLTSQNAPPDAVSEGNAGDCNTEGSAGFLCLRAEDVRRCCMIAAAVIIVLLALGIVYCCIFVRRRHRKTQQ